MRISMLVALAALAGASVATAATPAKTEKVAHHKSTKADKKADAMKTDAMKPAAK